MRTRILAISIASAAAVTLAACSSTDTTPGVSPTGAAPGATATSAPSTGAPARHNQADVQFNRMMIPHHRQAVQMADMVEGHTGNPQLLGLAKEIAAAQQPEIDQMTARLNSWDVSPTAGGHQGHSMAGMMSGQQMHQLSTMHGPDFDHQWLTMMIAHHEGAIAMAKTELASGADPASKQLANSIIAGQQKEIDRMRAMLGQ